jgi:hypothetical protein
MRSIRNIVGAGLAGGIPAYAMPESADRAAPPATCSAVLIVNDMCASMSTAAELAQLTAVEAKRQPAVTALTGSEQRFFSPTTSVWVSNGLTQVRGVRLTGTFAFSGSDVNLAGTETVVTNASLDATNNGDTWGTNTYTATGLKCTGSANGQIINALGTLIIVAPCGNGAMLVGTVQDVSTDPPNVAPPKSVKSTFKGVYISPTDR